MRLTLGRSGHHLDGQAVGIAQIKQHGKDTVAAMTLALVLGADAQFVQGHHAAIGRDLRTVQDAAHLVVGLHGAMEGFDDPLGRQAHQRLAKSLSKIQSAKRRAKCIFSPFLAFCPGRHTPSPAA